VNHLEGDPSRPTNMEVLISETFDTLQLCRPVRNLALDGMRWKMVPVTTLNRESCAGRGHFDDVESCMNFLSIIFWINVE
jgi:hypothetical protein